MLRWNTSTDGYWPFIRFEQLTHKKLALRPYLQSSVRCQQHWRMCRLQWRHWPRRRLCREQQVWPDRTHCTPPRTGLRRAWSGLDTRNTPHWRQDWGAWMAWKKRLHAFCSSVVYTRGEGSVSYFFRFSRKERTPGTHWKGGCVGPRVGLDGVANRKIHPRPYWDLNPEHPVHVTELSRLLI